VFLRQLTLKGFKSFAETTVLTFEPGVTVVVGPNGSGKSNIVDAVAWVLGAQAPSSVRSQKMDDVIFAGTARRPALGRAEVSLTIDNSAGLLPIEFTEVTLTRTLWRSGDSEYAINGVPCRLLDVQELLSDSGVGRQQHTIVSQGQIDGVLSARPEDRRAIIEEAAGVLKYRKRKERAERRLDSTEGNLLRLQDLLREVRRQLRPLERQAEAARRYGEVTAELTALRVFLAGREIAALGKRLEVLAGQAREGRDEQELRRRALAGLDTAVLAAEAQLTASGGTDVSDALLRVEQLRERARGLAAVLVERHRGLERARLQVMDSSVAASLEAEAAQLKVELADAAAARDALEPELAALPGEVDTAPTPSAAQAAAEVRGELRTRRAAVEVARDELQHLGARLTTTAERCSRVEEQLERLKSELSEGEAAEVPLVERLAAAEERRIGAESALEAAVAIQHAATTDHAACEARVETLTAAVDAARARAGGEHLAGVDGVLGVLSELIEVDAGWEAAIEAALGEALAAAVVVDAAAATRALDHLHRADATGGVIVPRPGAWRSSWPSGEAVRAHVRAADAAVTVLLDQLLDGAIAVTGSWREALEAALTHPAAVVVTKTGDRFSRTGWRLGLGAAGATATALEEARTRRDEMATELTRAEQAVELARLELDEARLDEAEATRSLDTHDAELAAKADAVARVQSERRELDQLRATVEAAHAAGLERRAREVGRIAELERALVDLDVAEAAEVELGGRRQHLAVREATIDQRRRLLTERLATVEGRLTEHLQSEAEAAERIERIERSLTAVARLSRLIADHRIAIEARLTELQDERRRQTEEARAASSRLEQLRRERAEAERALAELGERQRRVELDDAEARLRLEVSVESLRRDLDTEPDTAMAAPAPLLTEGVTPAARVRELERELRLMGPINPLALEEHTALQERHSFLEDQLEDVRNTRRDLQRVIRSVDAEIRAVFASAFADVSESFAALFTTLFPGGSGRLTLTEPDDPLATGIEIEAKPSGKNVKKLSLLSGGERSLTALAFLFAVFRSRPSPFYVMDEVEAALDDVNLHRFLSLVDEFRREAQLLVVSHQKRTMEAADCLIGVTMAPGGSSKVVTERVEAVV
jgi:chromosome segregation protein